MAQRANKVNSLHATNRDGSKSSGCTRTSCRNSEGALCLYLLRLHFTNIFLHHQDFAQIIASFEERLVSIEDNVQKEIMAVKTITGSLHSAVSVLTASLPALQDKLKAATGPPAPTPVSSNPGSNAASSSAPSATGTGAGMSPQIATAFNTVPTNATSTAGTAAHPNPNPATAGAAASTHVASSGNTGAGGHGAKK
jgi:hypothetical protein